MEIGEIVREVEALPVDPVTVPRTEPAPPVREPEKVPVQR